MAGIFKASFGVMAFLALSSWAENRLIGGQAAKKGDWPASVYASNTSGGRCSSTIIGSRTLLIAAHCVSNNAKVSFSANGQTYSGVCTHSPYYKQDNTADWALCLLGSDVTGVPYENLNRFEGRVRSGDTITLSGYGCIQSGGGGGNDGTFRVGQAKVTSIPDDDNDIVTRGTAALCYGDSGGAAFVVDANSGVRWVVGVNSRGNISTTSYLSSVSTPKAQTFIGDWAEKNGQKLCGFHLNAEGCRW